MTTEEDEVQTLDGLTAEVEDEEHIRFDLSRVAALEWDERMAHGRPEMTGQWLVHYRDGTWDTIDLPKANHDAVVAEAKTLIARKLTRPLEAADQEGHPGR